MPSLKALSEFKSKFTQIGGETQVHVAQNTPFDDLILPDHEPAPLQEANTDDDFGEGSSTDIPADDIPDSVSFSDMAGDDVFGVEDLPQGTLDETSFDDLTPSEDSFNDDFLNFSGLGDLAGGNTDLPAVPEAEADLPTSQENPIIDEFANDIAPTDMDIPAGFDSSGMDFPSETDNLDDFSLPDDLNAMGAEETDSGFPMDDVPVEEFPLDELPTDDFSTETLPTDDFSTDETPAGDFSTEDFPMEDFPMEEFPATEEIPGMDIQNDSGTGLGDMSFDSEDFGTETGSENDTAFPEFPSEVSGDFGTSPETENFGFDTDNTFSEDMPSSADVSFDNIPDDSFSTDDASGGPGGMEEMSFDTGGGFDTESGFDSSSIDSFNPGDLSSIPDSDSAIETEFPDEQSFGSDDFSGDQTFGGDDFSGDQTFGDGADLGGFETQDLGEIPLSGGDDSFSIPGDSFGTGDLPADNASFDNLDLDRDVLSSDLEMDAPGGETGKKEDHDLDALNDFNIPGLEDGFGPAPSSKKSDNDELGDLDDLRNLPPTEVHIEEIRLTDAQFDKLQDTILSYPLNLRVAAEQIIAEEAVSPELLSSFVKLLVRGAPAKEAASLASKILNKTISIPKGYEKRTGEALEAEQAGLTYIFVHKFLPVFRIYMAIALLVLSLAYLAYTFIYVPAKAEKIYEQGYERIAAGEYNWANRRFEEAFQIHPKTEWFYRYAEAFRDERQYIEAERKYQELMNYTASKSKQDLPDKQAVMDYAALATYYMRDYQKADMLLRRYILDYSLWDRDALLALGDNSLAWGEIEPERLEDAREAYAILLDRYGRTDPVLERMLKYFIITDSLREVLPLQNYFMFSERRRISAGTLADLGGYLIDKRTEEVRGVPNEYRDLIGGIRDVLLRSIRTDPLLPESYYHLSRYYNLMDNTSDEGLTLERSIQAFNLAKEETPKRLWYNIDALRRYADVLIKRREFFPAEEQLIRGVNLYENGISRRVISRSPEFGKLYASLGDLEYYVKSGDMNAAIDYYSRAERSGFSPPDMKYRMGAAHYQLEQWPQALNRFIEASGELPFNRRILYALGNVSYIRGNFYAAQAYYGRLLEILDADRARFPAIMPTENREQLELAERLMVAQNNLGVVLETLASRTGENRYHSLAMGFYTESERAWDVITRNPDTMIRMRPSPEIYAPGINPAFLNIQNNLRPLPDYEPQFFIRIDRDMLEPSPWEELAPTAYRLSYGLESTLN